jgi:hypothetical protein
MRSAILGVHNCQGPRNFQLFTRTRVPSRLESGAITALSGTIHSKFSWQSGRLSPARCTVVIGAGVLGLALAYGIIRTRGRTRAQKQATDEATKALYAREDRDREK